MKTQILLPGIALNENMPAVQAPPPLSEQDQPDGWPPMSEMLHSLFVFEPTIPQPEPITVLGLGCCGPWGLQALTPQQRELVEAADVICGGQRLLDAFSQGEDSDSPPLKARFLPLTLPLEPLLSRLSQIRAGGERVLMLADGDPLFFGIGATLARQLGAEAVRLIPAASSLQEACARLALPWHKVISLSLHGRDDLGPLNAAAGKGRPLCILTDVRTSPDVLARHLLDRGVDWFTAHIFERMGSPDEKRHELALSEAACTSFGPVCTMLLLPCDAPRGPHLGLRTAQLAVEGGLVSKPPVRATALSLLRIKPRHVVWDIGSGSGAVALEAAALAH
ncbi:MAG: precorrin-6y C5,15-methyltransferase (decarboxylating) subunit CbiE, partial [Desulfovibrionaceae bacterium]|nr:precorrin-6y C5,15-methyltransferase (decarboxylating) subunit CbiE [Desulfovibrionaceae bacterium]